MQMSMSTQASHRLRAQDKIKRLFLLLNNEMRAETETI